MHSIEIVTVYDDKGPIYDVSDRNGKHMERTANIMSAFARIIADGGRAVSIANTRSSIMLEIVDFAPAAAGDGKGG